MGSATTPKRFLLAALVLAGLVALPQAHAGPFDNLDSSSFGDAIARLIVGFGQLVYNITSIDDPAVNVGIMRGLLFVVLFGFLYGVIHWVLTQRQFRNANQISIVAAFCISLISLAMPNTIILSSIVALLVPVGAVSVLTYFGMIVLRGDRLMHLLGAAVMYLAFVIATYSADKFADFSGADVFFSVDFMTKILSDVAIIMFVIFIIKLFFLLFNQGHDHGAAAGAPAAPHH